jgi:LPXTG-motif cell wall-anchored protein
MKLTDGLSTVCYRVTSAYFFQLAFAPELPETEYDSVGTVDAATPESLADTGADISMLAIWMMVLIGLAIASLSLARRKDS